tara:strand:- start:22862 stop:23524 length:663 start_codon:yes stop_codon:yes gene_type:complete
VISKLPKWVEIGAFILALVAGCVNAVGLLSFEHQAVSHLSGTATLLGADLMQGNSLDAFHLFGVLLSFLVGSGIAGFLLHSSALKLGRHYDTALLIEAGLLLGALWLLFNGSGYGHFLASAACGLQNALATTYSGAIVRTTHVTGIFTDLGIMFGRVLRGETLDKRKAKLFGLIILGFILGGLAGAWLFAKLSFAALYVPSAICILLALTYRVYSHRSAT